MTDFEKLANDCQKYFKSNGMDEEYSIRAGKLLACCIAYRLSPQVTSIFRSAAQQKELIAAYKAGAKNVYTPLPVGKSLHGNTTWWGSPASLAFDMVVNNTAYSSYFAKLYGITWGGPRDPVHYGARGGQL